MIGSKANIHFIALSQPPCHHREAALGHASRGLPARSTGQMFGLPAGRQGRQAICNRQAMMHVLALSL